MIKLRYNSIGKIVLSSLFLCSLCFTGCSDDDDEIGSRISPYWVLGQGNPNMPSSGTIIAQYSDSPQNSGISSLVDNDSDTKYVTYHNAFDITWSGNSNIAALSYSIISAIDSPEMDPKAWKLSGSLDGTKWKVIDSQDAQSFSERKQTKTFELKNKVAYRFYKLSILNNNGGKATQIAEWVLSAEAFSGDIEDLMPLSSGNTFTTLTPMGTQHLNDHEATADDIAWLKDATQEPETFANLSWKSFTVNSLYPFGDPKPADVNQHSIGDCCACAVMASVAYIYPKFIKKIITDNGDQTFTVTLYDPKGSAVKVGVSNSFVADGNEKLGASSGKNDQVTWSTVLEKAMIKWKQVYGGSSDMGGIATEYVSAIITGNGSTFAFSPNKLTATELQRVVSVTLQQRMLVIGGFTDAGKPVDNKYKTVNGHAYSFSLPSDTKYLFSMRNPWGLLPLLNSDGYSDGKEDGLLNIEDDGVIPPIIDLRVCNPGAAKGYETAGNLEPYIPPTYSPSPMRVARGILLTGE